MKLCACDDFGRHVQICEVRVMEDGAYIRIGARWYRLERVKDESEVYS